MSRAEPLQQKGEYYSIKDGSFRLPSEQGNPKAIRREYTNPKTKESGVAYELGFGALSGLIKDIRFHENTLKDGTVLRSMNIILDENEENKLPIISLPIDSRYTSDFLKKLPNIDLEKEVRFQPYDFDPKEGARQVGISITQPDDTENFSVKIFNFFLEEGEPGEDGRKVYKNLHGFPEPTEEDKEDWKFYFAKVNKFLVKYVKENILPKFASLEHDKAIDRAIPEDGIDPKDIPF